jgi:hypothetical protein
MVDDPDIIIISTMAERGRAQAVAIGESIAWKAPIVMNTQEELRSVFGELGQSTFIKQRASDVIR